MKLWNSMAILVIFFAHLSNIYAANRCVQETMKNVAENKIQFIDIKTESFDDSYVKVANIKRKVDKAIYSRTPVKTFDEFTNSDYEDDASVFELNKEVEYVDEDHEMSVSLERQGSFMTIAMEFENNDFEITQNILINLDTCQKRIQDTEILYSRSDDKDKSVLHIKKQWKKVGSNQVSTTENYREELEDSVEVPTHKLRPKSLYDPFLKNVVLFEGIEGLSTTNNISSYTEKEYESTSSDYFFLYSNGIIKEEINKELFLVSRLVGDDGKVNEVIGINENNIKDKNAIYSIETPYELELDIFTTYSGLTKTDKVNDDGWPVYKFNEKIPNLSEDIEDIPPSEQKISDFDKKYLNISFAMKTDNKVFNNVIDRISAKNHANVRGLVQDALEEVKKLLVYDQQMAQGFPTTLSVDDILKSKKGVCQHYTLLASAVLRKLGVPTRQIGGLMFDSDDVGGHAWIEVKLDNDTYVPFEPQAASVVASGYIPMEDIYIYEDIEKHRYHVGKEQGYNALKKIRVIRN